MLLKYFSQPTSPLQCTATFTTYIQNFTFRDDDDINDVASMAGVNLSEENARILATNSELVGTQTRSCKDDVVANVAVLQRRMTEIGKLLSFIYDIVFNVSEPTLDQVFKFFSLLKETIKQKRFFS